MKKGLSFILFCSLLSCQSANNQTGADTTQPQLDPKTFNGSMQDLQETLTNLLPLAVDPKQYNAPENKKEIQSGVKKLLALSKNVRHSQEVALKDPSVVFISNAFTEDLERIDESLAAGKREYARYGLVHLTSYCIECHTRTSTGPSFRSPALEQTVKKLEPLERGEFLMATRQFDAALQEFSDYIDAKLAQKGDFADLDKAVRYSLAATVKYMKDPKKSLAIVEKIRKSKNAPYYLKQNARGWELAIREWMKEPKPKDFSPESVLKRARQWITRGQQLHVGMVDRGGDIYFLRALSDLHLLLVSQKNKQQLGEALYLTGLGYEATRDLGIWNLHENYYETCVRRVPHTEWAKKCFKRFQESVYFGYTGSAGTQVPLDVVRKLESLKSLAFRPGEE